MERERKGKERKEGKGKGGGNQQLILPLSNMACKIFAYSALSQEVKN